MGAESLPDRDLEEKYSTLVVRSRLFFDSFSSSVTHAAANHYADRQMSGRITYSERAPSVMLIGKVCAGRSSSLFFRRGRIRTSDSWQRVRMLSRKRNQFDCDRKSTVSLCNADQESPKDVTEARRSCLREAIGQWQETRAAASDSHRCTRSILRKCACGECQ